MTTIAIYINRNAGIRAILLLFYSFTLLPGCYTPRYVYSPAAQNIPLLTKKGDSKLGVVYSNNFPGANDSAGIHPYSYGIDIHSAYAISNRWALQLNYFLRSEKNGDEQGYRDQPELRYKRQMVEIGAGSYQKINGSEKKIFQFFAGAGFGKFSFTDTGIDSLLIPYSKFHESGVFKLYVQPAFMYIINKQTSLSVSSRFSIVHYSNINTDYSEQELINYELFTLGGDPILFWEPAFIHAIGFKKLPFIRLEYQLGFSALLSRRFIDARSFNFSAGVQADIAGLFKKKTASQKD